MRLTYLLSSSTLAHLILSSLAQLIVDVDFPDPELLILYGEGIELQGFPPWQLRLTEI